MGTENENIVTAELTMRITDDPAFEVISARNVEVASIQRLDVGHYQVTLGSAIPIGSLHIARHGRTVDKGVGTEEPRHVFAVAETDEDIGTFQVWCYDLSTPPVPVEANELVQLVWHASPEVPPIVVALEPAMIPP